LLFVTTLAIDWLVTVLQSAKNVFETFPGWHSKANHFIGNHTFAKFAIISYDYQGGTL
jgi:hypothetical protein